MVTAESKEEETGFRDYSDWIVGWSEVQIPKRDAPNRQKYASRYEQGLKSPRESLDEEAADLLPAALDFLVIVDTADGS
jgi:hypothetical protein